MKYLWSPWRMPYIQSSKPKDQCVFCEAQSQHKDAENYIIHRGEKSFVILNRYPYTSGHLMVIPYAHVSSLTKLDVETRAEMFELLNYSSEIIQKIYQPEGFNLGANIGKAAGAGVESHVHLHVVPRWIGDTNFMTSLGNTRVIPETLEDTYRKLSEIWKY